MTVLCALSAMLVHKIGRPSLFLLYMATSLLLSWGFYLTVEKPFMMISRKGWFRHKSTGGSVKETTLPMHIVYPFESTATKDAKPEASRLHWLPRTRMPAG
jgi:peptidoglycan/LPS O-acetylase OafA/YrhL